MIGQDLQDVLLKIMEGANAIRNSELLIVDDEFKSSVGYPARPHIESRLR